MQKLMVLFFILTTFLIAENDLTIQLAVDTNRDGKVDFDNDDFNEDSWTRSSGAIFFYNNDSDENNGRPDCFDDKINGENDFADLATVLLQKIPTLPNNAKVFLDIDFDSKNKINLFVKKQNQYLKIKDFPFYIASNEIKTENLTFYIEAKSYANPDWSSIVKITATVEADKTVNSDTVVLKVAPFILLPNTQKVNALYIRAYPGKNDVMIQQLQNITAKSHVHLEIVPADLYPYNQIWMQDTMEIGYSEGANHWFNVVLPANRNRPLDNWAETNLLGKDYGWFRYSNYRHEFARGGGENGWLDWYGNLEVSPPFNGYPLGRIYYGSNGINTLNPEIIEMLNHQNVQGTAVKLDTGWLLIKHVDEVLSFVPTGNVEKPYKALLPSTKVTIELLQKWQKEGKGNLKILSRNNKNWTINSLLENPNLIKYNQNLQSRIENIYALVKKEFDLEEQDIIYIPALLSNGESLIPNMVNSVFLNDNLLMADPNGPRFNNKDLLQEYVQSLFQEIPCKVHFLDDWKYHTWAGNVHCATNTKREKLATKWWEK